MDEDPTVAQRPVAPSADDAEERTRIAILANQCEGWLTRAEGEALYDLARGCTDGGVIVEIGSWKGKSTTWLAYGAKRGDGAMIYAVDPHTGSSETRKMFGDIWTFDEFQRNMAVVGVTDSITPLVMTAREAAKEFTERVSFVFIDADHRYEHVKDDFAVWFPKLAVGGIIAFHDTLHRPRSGNGPKRVVGELLRKSPEIADAQIADSITWMRKTRRASPKERLGNLRLLRAKTVTDARLSVGRVRTAIASRRSRS